MFSPPSLSLPELPRPPARFSFASPGPTKKNFAETKTPDDFHQGMKESRGSVEFRLLNVLNISMPKFLGARPAPTAFLCYSSYENTEKPSISLEFLPSIVLPPLTRLSTIPRLCHRPCPSLAVFTQRLTAEQRKCEKSPPSRFVSGRYLRYSLDFCLAALAEFPRVLENARWRFSVEANTPIGPVVNFVGLGPIGSSGSSGSSGYVLLLVLPLRNFRLEAAAWEAARAHERLADFLSQPNIRKIREKAALGEKETDAITIEQMFHPLFAGFLEAPPLPPAHRELRISAVHQAFGKSAGLQREKTRKKTNEKNPAAVVNTKLSGPFLHQMSDRVFTFPQVSGPAPGLGSAASTPGPTCLIVQKERGLVLQMPEDLTRKAVESARDSAGPLPGALLDSIKEILDSGPSSGNSQPAASVLSSPPIVKSSRFFADPRPIAEALGNPFDKKKSLEPTRSLARLENFIKQNKTMENLKEQGQNRVAQHDRSMGNSQSEAQIQRESSEFQTHQKIIIPSASQPALLKKPEEKLKNHNTRLFHSLSLRSIRLSAEEIPPFAG